MHPARHASTQFVALVVLLIPFASTSGWAQVPGDDALIAAATLPLPDGMRNEATVIGWNDSGERTQLREGSNSMICIADEPSDERFRVVCYAESLHPLLSRNRELREEGLEEAERDRQLEEEVEAGSIGLPEQPAVLHVVNGPAGSYDPATGEVSGEVRRLRIIFTPYQSAEEMGLPTERHGDAPWVMDSGKLFSHIMIVQEGGEEGE